MIGIVSPQISTEMIADCIFAKGLDAIRIFEKLSGLVFQFMLYKILKYLF